MPPNFAEYYDAVINWEKRLARELPLLVELARSAGRRVLIPACGTGAHVVALARQGFSVLGFDADEEMVALTQQRIDREATAISAAGGEGKAASSGWRTQDNSAPPMTLPVAWETPCPESPATGSWRRRLRESPEPCAPGDYSSHKTSTTICAGKKRPLVPAAFRRDRQRRGLAGEVRRL